MGDGVAGPQFPGTVLTEAGVRLTTGTAPLEMPRQNASAPPTPVEQIAAVVTATPGDTFEIALAPEELGRVHMHLEPSDGTLTVLIQADRPETLDLLRRNGEALAQDFRALGYEDVSLDFRSGGGSGRYPGAAPPGAAVLNSVPQIALMLSEPAIILPPGATIAGGLDLRL